MLKRKHRIVVEMTTNVALTEKEATLGLSLLLDSIDTQAKPIWANGGNVYADKLVTKQYSKVHNSDNLKAFYNRKDQQ